MDNIETLETLGTQDPGRRQTEQKKIQHRKQKKLRKTNPTKNWV